ncbi:MAG: NRDE family protein [Anaerolineae bacterium]
MCTVTWLDGPSGYALWFNRDERPARLPELPPARAESSGVPYIAPRDSVAGGSWLAVNAHGVTVGLLNHYAADAARAGSAGDEMKTSRGLLVLSLMACESVGAVVDGLAGAGAAAFRPFELIALDAAGDRALATWDGTALSVIRGRAVRPPISSSGFDTAAVVAARTATYGRLVGAAGSAAGAPLADRPPTLARLEAFHRSHVPEPGAYSVCMHRPDARTISLTLVTVDADAVAMRHGPGSACTAVLGPPVLLARLDRR